MQTLVELGIQNETTVIFSSDHGDMQGSHGLLNKCLPYEESCGVPLIITQPDGQKGISVDDLVSTIDFYPTCLEYANQPKNVSKPGRSLVPIITGKKVEDVPVFSEIRIKSFIQFVMIRTTQYKMAVRLQDNQPYLLYDMQNDPYEMDNLIDKDAYASIKADLLQKVLEWETK